MHHVRGYRRKDGTYVRPHQARDPGRRVSTAQPTRHAKPMKRGAAVALTVTIAGIGIAAVTLSSGLSGSSASLSDEGGARPASAEAPVEVRLDLNRTEAMLLASGYRVNLDVRFDKNCATNSYGPVHHFFLSDPCKWLARASLTLRESGHAAVLVAISWVDMRNIALAEQYKHLVDAPGTGNIAELTHVSGPYRSVRFTGGFYRSGIAGKTAVWNAEVQPVGRVPVTVTRKILSDSRQ
jgi:hypothetical protein